MSASEQRVTKAGVHYDVWNGGGGTPTLLAHGQMLGRQSLLPLAERLSTERAVVSLDLPSHGATPLRDDADWRVFHEAVLGVLDDVGWRTCTAVGHSLGALALGEAGLVAPERFEKVFLVGFPGAYGEDKRAQMRQFAGAIAAAGFPDELMQQFTQLAYGAAYKQQHPDLWKRVASLVREVNTKEAAARVCSILAEAPLDVAHFSSWKLPCTVIAMREDQLTPFAAAEPAVKAMGAEVVWLECGHMAHEEALDDLVALLA